MQNNNSWSSIKKWIMGKSESSVSPALSIDTVRKFYLPVVKAGELWCVINDEGWVEPGYSFAGQMPRCVWASREAADEFARKESGASAKIISLQRFLYELLDDWAEDGVP